MSIRSSRKLENTRKKLKMLEDRLIELDWSWTGRVSNYSACKKLGNHKMGVALCASCPLTAGRAKCRTVGGRATPAAWNTPPEVPLTSSPKSVFRCSRQ
jgi:hypothetical protein